MITVSVVSHGHGAMVESLLAQLRGCPEVTRIVLTLNIPEDLSVVADDVVRIVRNTVPKGFGANHNAAFVLCDSPYFCVLNPDISLNGNPFPGLLVSLIQSQASLVAPLILSPEGKVEDSARHFPTIFSLLHKVFGGDGGRYSIEPGPPSFCPDWVAGMFLLFRTEAFAALRGFDEDYFLYYEDVDICKRTWLMGQRVAVCPSVHAVHDARRASRLSLRHMRWHLASMVRYLWRYR